MAAHYFATVFANAVLAKEEQLKEQAGKLHVQEVSTQSIPLSLIAIRSLALNRCWNFLNMWRNSEHAACHSWWVDGRGVGKKGCELLKRSVCSVTAFGGPLNLKVMVMR